ncbi:MAG: DUF4124 domain-containing protein [Nitrosomonadales bacterium]|nr:DUF4124 domain-containing protein [Nitrosomonadales bacterium]
MSPYILLPLLLVFSASAHAQVYKCKSANQQVVYSDSPCDKGHVEVITDIMMFDSNSPTEDSQSRVMRQLDNAVISAINANDLDRAKALATTSEHKAWVAQAEKEIASQPQKSEATLKAEMASSTACENAKRNLEAEAKASFSNPEVLEARKSLMYAACGVIEPVVIQQQSQPSYIYGYPYRFRYNESKGYRKDYGHRKGSDHKSRYEYSPSQKSGISIYSAPSRKQ